MRYNCEDFEQANWKNSTKNCCKNCRWWDEEIDECDFYQKAEMGKDGYYD